MTSNVTKTVTLIVGDNGVLYSKNLHTKYYDPDTVYLYVTGVPKELTDGAVRAKLSNVKLPTLDGESHSISWDEAAKLSLVEPGIKK